MFLGLNIQPVIDWLICLYYVATAIDSDGLKPLLPQLHLTHFYAIHVFPMQLCQQ